MNPLSDFGGEGVGMPVAGKGTNGRARVLLAPLPHHIGMKMMLERGLGEGRVHFSLTEYLKLEWFGELLAFDSHAGSPVSSIPP